MPKTSTLDLVVSGTPEEVAGRSKEQTLLGTALLGLLPGAIVANADDGVEALMHQMETTLRGGPLSEGLPVSEAGGEAQETRTDTRTPEGPAGT